MPFEGKKQIYSLKHDLSIGNLGNLKYLILIIPTRFVIRDFARPKVVISKCIEFDHCRYDGQMISSDFVDMLKPYAEFIPVCAEMEIEPGVPRDAIRIISAKDELRLFQPATCLDVTESMWGFTDSFISSLKEVDGVIPKFRSPSCDIKEVRVSPGRKVRGYWKDGRVLRKCNPQIFFLSGHRG